MTTSTQGTQGRDEAETGATLEASVRVGPLSAAPGAGRAATIAHGGFTVAQLVAIMPSCPPMRAERHLGALNRAMAEHRIESDRRRAAFIAQVAAETAELAWFEELGSGADRDPRTAPLAARSIGNTDPGDGKRYKARGALPLVGREAYLRAGRALGLDLVRFPELAAGPAIALRIAGHVFESRGANALADEGMFLEITRNIAGFEADNDTRLAYYERALAALAT
jgi:predicted chitinase